MSPKAMTGRRRGGSRASRLGCRVRSASYRFYPGGWERAGKAGRIIEKVVGYYGYYGTYSDADNGQSLGQLLEGLDPIQACIQGTGNFPHQQTPPWLKKAEQGSRNRLQGGTSGE